MTLSLFLLNAPFLSVIKTSRAGVIPFTKVNKQLYFLLGIDTCTQELTDFGGGVKIKETSLSGALREFREETNDIFPLCTYDVLDSSTAVLNSKMAIIFLEINNSWFYTASKKFKNVSENSQEISNIVWIHENKFRNLILYNNDKTFSLWKKIQIFFKGDIDIILKHLKI